MKRAIPFHRSKITLVLVALLGLFVLAISSCGPLAAGPVGPQDGEGLATRIALTVIAQITQAAPTSTAAIAPLPTETPPPTSPPPTPAATTPPATPTVTSIPATPTATTRCNQADFVRDVTIPDGTIMVRGAEFTKTWRLENIGTCTWNEDYSLVFVNGAAMNARSSYELDVRVRPGEVIDLTVDLVAPDKAGRHRGYWMLREPSGVLFGLGAKADVAFWVEIVVGSPTALVYDFTAQYCAADWSSGAGDLSCPGEEGDDAGFVQRVNNPSLEYARENEYGLLTRPEDVRGGIILGEFPAYKVQEGDRFKTVTACLADHGGCHVTFQLSYQAGDGPVKTLETWHEKYDGKPTRIDVDLQRLAGRNVRFILQVLADGPAEDDLAFWLNPAIWRVETSNTGENPGTGTGTSEAQAAHAGEAARQFLASQLGVPAGLITVTGVEPAVWSDSCLGIQLPSSFNCRPTAPATGFRVLLNVDGRLYEAHTTLTANFIYWTTR